MNTSKLIKTKPEYVHYIRDAKGNPFGCLVIQCHENKCWYGWSLCNKNDTFSKKTAKAIARARLKKALDTRFWAIVGLSRLQTLKGTRSCNLYEVFKDFRRNKEDKIKEILKNRENVQRQQVQKNRKQSIPSLFEYIRDPKTNRRIGIVLAFKGGGAGSNFDIFYGWSLCCPKDKFDRNIGFQEAFKKAITSHGVPETLNLIVGKKRELIKKAVEKISIRANKYFKV